MGAEAGSQGGAPETAGRLLTARDAGPCESTRPVSAAPLAKGPGQDPTIPHVALAVADIQETKAEELVSAPAANVTSTLTASSG